MLDEFRSTSITWDKATRRIYSPITANASDSNGRKLNIQVVNSGQVENLTGATLHLYWETKDKAHDGLDAFDASDISKGEFELFYTTGMLSNVGELNATLVLVDSTGKVVSDWFKITVTRGINEGAIESENSFSSLTQALIDISNLEQNYAPRLNDLTAQLQQKEDLDSLKYVSVALDSTENFTRDNDWNRDPNTLSNEAYHSRNIVMLGDSHSWGEGGPNYQGASSGYNPHAEWIHNTGYFGRLKKYLEWKMDSEPWRSIAEPDFYGATVNVFQPADERSKTVKTNKPKYTKSLAVKEGDFRLVKVTKEVPQYLLNAKARNDTYSIAEYKHNAEIGMFGEYFLEFKPQSGGKTAVLAEIETPTRFVVVNLLCGASQGKVRIELLDYTDDYNVAKTTFGHSDYGTATPVVYRNMVNFNSRTAETNVTINSGSIEIDCAQYTGENNFIIDFKQKKQGVIKLSHADGSTAIIDTRGVITSNFDMVKNWSLGGHPVGAFIGVEGNYNNAETRDHVTDMVKYMYLPAKLIIFQAPIVNDYLKQTPIDTFKSNLTSLLQSSILTTGGSDILVFNTIGTQSSEFDVFDKPITDDMYNVALQDWCKEKDIKFIDFRGKIKHLIATKALTNQDIYINNGHPSPLYNEIIFKHLKDEIDMII